MTQLDDTFNLDNIKKAMALVGKKDEPKETDTGEVLERAVQQTEDNNVTNFLDTKFPDDAFDNDMDKVADAAVQKAEDLYDIAAQQVDARHIGDVANASARFLEIMLNAKSAKTKRKMDLYQMSLRERDITLKEIKLKNDMNQEDAPEVESVSSGVDRNDLLNEFSKTDEN